jgi:hypothetical protein
VKHCTMVWHVDDLKISTAETRVVDDFIRDLEKELGKDTPLCKSRGKLHDYLGMILDFSVQAERHVNMTNYVKMVLANAPDDMQGTMTTPMANHFYKVNETDPGLRIISSTLSLSSCCTWDNKDGPMS